MFDKKITKVISYDPISNIFAVEIDAIEDSWGDTLRTLAQRDKDKKIIKDYINYNTR